LIHDSEVALEDPLEKVRTELKDFYEKKFSRKAITNKVDAMAKEYQDILGDFAEFWYLLAVGVAIANPQSYGRLANPHLATAKTLDEKSSKKFYPDYCTLLRDELTRRHDADDFQMAAELRSKYWTPLLRVEREISNLDSNLVSIS
jgi:hypothetical protein